MPDILLPPTQPRTPWFPKFAECAFAGIAIFNSSLMLQVLLPKNVLFHLGPMLVGLLLVGPLVIGLIFGLGYSLFWHSRERRNAIDSGRLHAWFQGILRYWLAFTISVYGFGKIFRTQFGPSFSRNDTPISQLNGFELTWNYFGHSYPLALIIAGLQIGGSILLLFRRTTLLGVAILLPVMMNILLINVFFNIAPGAFLNSVLFTLGLGYLLYLRRKELIRVFLRSDDPLPAIRRSGLKWAARLLAIGGAFMILYITVHRYPADSPLVGKWTVDELIRNRDTIGTDAWLANSGAWRSVYIERYSQLHLCPNPYIYDRQRSLDAGYQYDGAKHEIRLIFNGANGNKGDTVTEAVSDYDGIHMTWEGMLSGDTVQLRLSRAGE